MHRQAGLSKAVKTLPSQNSEKSPCEHISGQLGWAGQKKRSTAFENEKEKSLAQSGEFHNLTAADSVRSRFSERFGKCDR